MKRIFCAIVIAMFVLARPVFAAEVFFGAPSETLPSGQETAIGVFVNTEDETVNAFEGRVVVPATLTIQQVDLANSLVTFWVESPHVDGPCAATCEVTFSGIIPGGYNTPNGQLFALRVLPIGQTGDVTVTAKDVRVLLNDGKGTDATVRISPITVHAESTAAWTSFSSPAKYGIILLILLAVICYVFFHRRIWGSKT